MTDREQKINEMTKLVEAHSCDDVCVYCKYSGLKNCERLHDMETLYNAGYRKMDEITLRLDLSERSAEEIKQIAEAFNGDIKKQVAKEIIQLMKQVQAMFYDKEYVAIQNLIAEKYGVEIEK